MKIVQFMASQGWGGAEKVFVELCNQLSKDHAVTAILLRDTVYRNRFTPDVSICTLQSNPTRRNPFLLYELLRALQKIKPS